LKVSWFGSALCILLLTTALQGQSRENLLKALEQTTWKPAGTPTEYDENNIETLAGERAAAINEYGLVGATVQDWAAEEGTVRLTLYEMVDPTSAYGLLTLERNIGQPGLRAFPVGSEGFRRANRFFFWQSKYLVRLDGEPSAAESLGRLVSENILGQSRKPPVSGLLPPNHLVQGSERYVLHP
jgi:hypothetical protein